MGSEATCTVIVGRRKAEGQALLETDVLIFRGGDVRLSIPYASMSQVDVRNGVLRVVFPEGVASFALGDVAPKWAEKIRHPPSRMDKLGVKKEQLVLLVGLHEDGFRRELEAAGASVSTRATTGVDLVFHAAADRAELGRLKALQDVVKRDGAIWVVRPKGSAAVSEADVRKAGLAAGLVDVKVVRFSVTHTAEKFVIPVARRSPGSVGSTTRTTKATK